MEEVLTGETDEGRQRSSNALPTSSVRSASRRSPIPPSGLSAEELAGCVTQTLALPEIAALRPGLLAEFPVYAVRTVKDEEIATAGIADALTVGPEVALSLSWTGRATLIPILGRSITIARRSEPIST